MKYHIKRDGEVDELSGRMILDSQKVNEGEIYSGCERGGESEISEHICEIAFLIECENAIWWCYRLCDVSFAFRRHFVESCGAGIFMK